MSETLHIGAMTRYPSVLGGAASGSLTDCSGDEGRAGEATEIHGSSIGPVIDVSATDLPPNNTTVTVNDAPPTLMSTANNSTATEDNQ